MSKKVTEIIRNVVHNVAGEVIPDSGPLEREVQPYVQPRKGREARKALKAKRARIRANQRTSGKRKSS